MLPAESDGKVPPAVSSLKRPPPSPSTTSSPKRAASEDPLGGESQPTHTQVSVSALPSSPLGMDVDDNESPGWVARTGQVSLNSDAAGPSLTPEELAERSKEVQGAVMASGSPPFTPAGIYYMISKALFTALTTYACSGEGEAPDMDAAQAAMADGSAVELWAPGRDAKAELQPFWRLRPGLEEDVDYMFTGTDGWDKLTELFGYSEAERPTFPRVCMTDGRIEVSPNLYKLHIVTTSPSVPVPPATPPAPITITLPRSSTIKQLREFVRVVFAGRAGPTAPLRVFALDAAEPPAGLEVDAKDLPSFDAKLLTGNDATLETLGLADGDSLVVEIGTPGFTLNVDAATSKAVHIPNPLFAKPAFYSGNGEASSSSSSSNQLLTLANAKGPMTRSQLRGKSGGKGLVGLSNLGNTCFLASATQCLSNTHVLVDYFLTGVYREELNPDNPLGMHGQVAEAFGDTVENLWESPSFSSFAPRRLKGTCSRFAPQFAGYGQHDTQEFLAFLLDGLHEDLNRIKKKPYIEKPDWKPGGGDRELAELGKSCWEGYKERNDSVIVDLFQGQLQSTLVCPDCHKESITMDPFMYLTVPLPISQTRTIKVVFFPRDVEKPPVNVHLLVPANASFATVKEKLARLTGAQAGNIAGFDFWKNSVYSWWMDAEPNTQMSDSDVGVFYEVGAPVTQTAKGVGTIPTDGSLTVPVYTFAGSDAPRPSYQRAGSVPDQCSVEPFFITLSKAEASDPAAVREAITRGYSRLVRPDKRDSLWVSANDPHAKPVVDDDESVAEIHLGGSSPETTLAPPRPSGEIQRTQSSASLASQSGRLVPRGDLFKVFVADASSAESNISGGFGGSGLFGKKDPAVNSFYKGSPSRAAGSWSSLEKRSRARRPMLQRISSGISSLVGSNGGSAANSDDEGDEAGSSSSTSIRKGEGIFVEWSETNLHEYFETPRDQLLRTLEDVVDPEIAKDQAKKRAGRSITLDDCLDEFSKQETLGRDDEWYCPQCKKHVQATKKLDIYKAPDILVICLKRFGSSRTLRDKLDHLVQYPLEGLNLDERIGERRITQTLKLTDEEAKHYGIEHSTEPFIYDLYAVDNHFGGLGGGHYTAFCRNKVEDQWYNYDDSRVSKASPEAVQNNRAAYLLFYKRRTARRIGGLSRLKAEEASRAATPMGSMPASPNIGPSVPASALASGDPSGPGSPASTSPIVSDDDAAPADSSDDDVPMDTDARVDLPTAAAVGYGNTAWGARDTAPAATAHSFGILTPDSSDNGDTDEFVEVSAPSASVSGPSESGLGEGYDVVRHASD